MIRECVTTHGVIRPLEPERDLPALGTDLPRRHTTPREEIRRNHATNRTTPRARYRSTAFPGLDYRKRDGGRRRMERRVGTRGPGRTSTAEQPCRKVRYGRGARARAVFKCHETQTECAARGGHVSFGHPAGHAEDAHTRGRRRGQEGCAQSAGGRALETVESRS